MSLHTLTIGHGKRLFTLTAAVVCEDETLRSETLTVAANQKSVAIHRAEQFVHENWQEADPRIDYRVVISGTEEVAQ